MTNPQTMRLRPRGVEWFAGNAISAALIVFCCVVAFVPIAPAFPDSSLDGSWAFALNAAVAKGLVFGRDIVFTFGPYASAYTGLYHPATDSRMLWSSAIMALAFAAGLICLSNGKRRLMMIPVACSMVLMPRDALFLASPFPLMLISCRVATARDKRTCLALTSGVQFCMALLVVAAALLCLVKGTFGVAACVALGLSCLALWRQRRTICVAGAAVFSFSLVTFWLIAHQPLSALPGFFTSLLPIMSGYSEAMSLEGPAYQVALYLVSCAALLSLIYCQSANTGLPGWVQLAGTGLLLFLAFKEGFVRQDGHVFIAAWFAVLIGSISLNNGSRWLLLSALIACLLSSVLYSGMPPRLAIATLAPRLEAPFLAAGRSLTARTLGAANLRSSYADALAGIRAERPLSRINGTADIYPIDQSLLLANDFTWAPRPVLQSYSAYTPALATLDAAHLSGPTAPDRILFFVRPFGSRLAAQDDGASWPTLLSRYSAETFDNGAIILRRSEHPLASPVETKLLLDRSVRLGEAIHLPVGSAMLWADFQVRPTLLGRVLSAAYKAAPLSIEYHSTDGAIRRFRFIAGMGEGFLASPIVESARDFLSLRADDKKDHFAGRHPTSIVISADYGNGWLWQSAYRARLSVIRPSVDARAAELLPNPILVQADRRAALPKTNDCSIDRIDGNVLARGTQRIAPHVRVDGWGAVSARSGDVGTGVALTLTSTSGEVRLLPARRMTRPDVSAYFERPDLAAAGFIAEGEFSVPDGDYTLGVDVLAGKQTWVCAHQLPVHISSK